MVDHENKFISYFFKNKQIITSFLQNLPGRDVLYKSFFPLYPLVFEKFDFSDYDIVISHTTRFANSIITKPGTLHISITHTPPRFLWNLPSDNVSTIVNPILSYLRAIDQIAARRVDVWIAGSINCKERIRKIYKKESIVIPPFIDPSIYENLSNFEGDYFLVISRLNSYKKIDLVVSAFNYLYKENTSFRKYKLFIIGDGPQRNSLEKLSGPNTELLGFVSEAIKLTLLAGCKGVIVPGEEDFGIVPLEAQATGKGVIAFGRGGALESIIDKKTGIFFKNPFPESVADTILKFLNLNIDPQDCKLQAKKFSKDKFRKQILSLINTV